MVPEYLAATLWSLLAVTATYACYVYLWAPAALGRALKQRGFTVLSYKPIFGDLPEMKRMEDKAQLSDMPLSDDDGLLIRRILPFFDHHLRRLSLPLTPANLVFWSGNRPSVFLTDADDARSVMSSDAKNLAKTPSSVARFHQLLGHGLLLASGDAWNRQRSILRPAFFTDKLKNIVTDIVASSLVMVEAWEQQVHKQGHAIELEVAYEVKNLTADILSRSFFGSSYFKGKFVFQRQERLLELLSELKTMNGVIPFYEYLPTRKNHIIREMEKRNNEELHEIIVERKKNKNHLSTNEPEYPYGTDLLGLILAAEDIGIGNKKIHLTMQEVIDQCKTFFFAGHETTANLLAWTLMLLSVNQEWQERARHEVMEVCGEKGNPTSEHLNRLHVVGMILNESLRLYPPVPAYGTRYALNNKVKMGGRWLPQGTQVNIGTLFMHRDKKVWGEDANEFRPERFENGVSKSCTKPHAFMPFGMGPRICIGQNFAIMESKVILSVILQRFRFHLSPNYRHAPHNMVTMRPRYGVQLILEAL